MSTRGVKPGDVLGGKYKVERVLGAGGMGVVVAARHVDLGQRVALKFMLKEAMAGSNAERFLREAKAAVQLKSVHTARVLDVGRLKNGEPFMVMEYLEGRDLDAELQARGPLPPHIAVEYILQACEALAEAHALGMIHRDVKLKNMFLTQAVDGRPLVKVLDFGLAKQLGSHGDVSLTATNTVFGSPQYMSPEQMRSAKDVDHRSDIWSLGVCLYELVTGRVPFDASGVAEICAMVLKDPVPPPSQFVFGLPPDLEEVILRCLEKDPNNRYQSVAELAFALQSYGADEGSARRILHVMQTTARSGEHATLISALPPSFDGPKTLNAWDSGTPTRRSMRLLTRPQLVTAIAGLLLLALIGLASIAVVVARKPPADTAAAASTPPPEATEPALELPDDPPTAPTGTIIGASPPPTPEPEPTTSPTATTAPEPTATSSPRPARTARPTTTAPKPPSTATAAPAPKPSSKSKGPGSGADYM